MSEGAVIAASLATPWPVWLPVLAVLPFAVGTVVAVLPFVAGAVVAAITPRWRVIGYACLVCVALYAVLVLIYGAWAAACPGFAAHGDADQWGNRAFQFRSVTVVFGVIAGYCVGAIALSAAGVRLTRRVMHARALRHERRLSVR